MASFNAFKIRLQKSNHLFINVLFIVSSSFLSINRNYIIYIARTRKSVSIYQFNAYCAVFGEVDLTF